MTFRSTSGASMSMHDERDAGTLARLLVAPGGFTRVLCGKLAARLVVGIVQMLLLLGWGHWMFGVSLDDKQRLRVHRLAIVGIGAVAYVLGRFFPTVLELQMYSYTVYGVAIAPPVLAIFFWQRASRWGAISSMVVATVSTIVWEQLGRPFDVNAVLISLPLTLVTLVVVSLLVPNRDRTDVGTPVTAADEAQRWT